MDGKHSMRLQNVNVYVWTGPKITKDKTLTLKRQVKCLGACIFVIFLAFLRALK